MNQFDKVNRTEVLMAGNDLKLTFSGNSMHFYRMLVAFRAVREVSHSTMILDKEE